MRTKKPSSATSPQAALPLATVDEDRPQQPDFLKLLLKPVVRLPLPHGFDHKVEAEHLKQLWENSRELRAYRFESFIHAGGSGIVFKVSTAEEPSPLALKIVREKLYSGKIANPSAAQSLSPVSPQELRALRRLSHANIVRLHDALADAKGVFAIATSFVANPKPFDQYLLDTLEQHPDPKGKKGLSSFSPERLDGACAFLVARFIEVVDALVHMHEHQLFHCDLKPANILISSDKQAVITDLGSCVGPDDADENGNVTVQFTWTYAHPKLTDLVTDPHGISGGGLKAWAGVPIPKLDVAGYSPPH